MATEVNLWALYIYTQVHIDIDTHIRKIRLVEKMSNLDICTQEAFKNSVVIWMRMAPKGSYDWKFGSQVGDLSEEV